MQKFLSTRISIVSRSKGKCRSAIDANGYIEREERDCEYDWHHYKPDAKEDLVHKEVNLPENAPEEFKDSATLWNSVEMIEKSPKAQLCRMMKMSLPNEWTYEVAEEVVRKYVMDNFVSKGMCANWAIHDAVNEKGQRTFTSIVCSLSGRLMKMVSGCRSRGKSISLMRTEIKSAKAKIINARPSKSQIGMIGSGEESGERILPTLSMKLMKHLR